MRLILYGICLVVILPVTAFYLYVQYTAFIEARHRVRIERQRKIIRDSANESFKLRRFNTDLGKYCFQVQGGNMVVVMGRRDSPRITKPLPTAWAYLTSASTCPQYLPSSQEELGSELTSLYKFHAHQFP